MKRRTHLMARVFDAPLAIHPAKLRQVVYALNEHGGLGIDGLTVAAFDDEPLPSDEGETFRGFDLVDGVAVFNIHGTLVHRGGALDAISGLVSYERLQASIDRALDDAGVHAILLDIDSGGGEVAGLFDLMDHIAAARDDKPMAALAHDFAASAAFGLASATGDVMITQSAHVGSVGVIAQHIDQTKRNEEFGVTVTEIFAGKFKADGSRNHVLGDDERGRLQASIDTIYDGFAGKVAKNLGTSRDAIQALESGMFIGADAIGAGLARSVTSFDEAVDRMARLGNRSPQFIGASRSRSTAGAKPSRQSQGSADMTQRTFVATTGLAMMMVAATDVLVSMGKSHSDVVNQLAEQTAFTADQLTELFAGTGKSIAEADLDKLANALGVSADHLKDAAEPVTDAARGKAGDGGSAGSAGSAGDAGGQGAGNSAAADIAERCTAAGVPALAAKLIGENVTPEQAQTRIAAAIEVRDVCAGFGRADLAEGYIANGMTPALVRATLDPLVGDGAAISSQHGSGPAGGAAATIDTAGIYAARRATVLNAQTG